MFKCKFAFLLCVMFLVKEINATIFCPGHVLETLIKCLLKTNIQPLVEEVHGLELNTFYQRLACAKQADCTPSLWQIGDKEIQTMKNFDDCMTRIPILKYTWWPK